MTAWQDPQLESLLALLNYSHKLYYGKELFQGNNLFETAYYYPAVIAAHNNEAEPKFIYANEEALELWELEWSELIGSTSRNTAEASEQVSRSELLAQVKEKGFIENYSGTRVSSTQKRFIIEEALVWQITDPLGQHHGQAVKFNKWNYIH